MYRKLDLNSLKPLFNGLFVHVYFMLQIMTENDQGKFLKQCEVFVDIVEGKGNHQVSIRGRGATVPIFKTQLRSVFPGPPVYFTEFILGMVISYYHIRMGI